MMFRFLEPDCQILHSNCEFKELDFWGIYVRIKNTDLKITEIERFKDKHANAVLNEHFLVVFILLSIFKSIREIGFRDDNEEVIDLFLGFADEYCKLLKRCGWNGEIAVFDKEDGLDKILNSLEDVAEDMNAKLAQFFKRFFKPDEYPPYTGTLCGYMDFLFPLLVYLKNMRCMPSNNIFLLLDDADNLNITQTQILNSWVATRTSGDVSIKISTQLRYKTYYTLSGFTIDAPHDYSEVNISTRYTTSKGTYKNRIKNIVENRLVLAGLENISVEEFFPCNEKQEEDVVEMGEHIRNEWKKGKGGSRPSDDVMRYARPQYMKSLSGKSKSKYSYSYSGFDQLVHISSGIIRYFLEAAAEMYTEVKAKNEGQIIKFIPHGMQNEVVRKQADKFLFDEFDKLYGDNSVEAPPKTKLQKLQNLIKALGGIFGLKLLSDDKERRVFSIAFSDDPDEEVKEILELGEHLGYLHKSTIGNKDGTGRTYLYILNRRLTPYFYLDPTSFAGYLFVTNDKIRQALYKPNTLLRNVKTTGTKNFFEERQLKLFDTE